MRTLTVIAISLLVSACGAGKHASESGASQKLLITGSSTIAPLATELAKAYEQDHPGIRIDVQAGGSAKGIADVRNNLSDIGMVSRAIKSSEKDLTATTIARDGVTIIVNQDNPVSSLSSEQIIAVYTGKISNWSALGGEDVAITVVHKAEGRSTLEVFLNYFHIDNQQVKPSIIIGDNEQAIKVVQGNPNAIAYVSIGTAEYDVEHGTPIKLVALDGVDASTMNIANGKFPLTRELNLITYQSNNNLAQDFLNYAKSRAVKPLVEAQSFVSLSD